MSGWPARLPAALLLAASLAAAPAGAHDTKSPPPAEATAKNVTITAGEFHEECLDLASGQRLHYAFRGAAALDFNIHYHRGSKIQYPVRKRDVVELSGTYVPRRGDGYCMMWRNLHPKPVALDYRFAISGRKSSKNK